MQTLDTNSLVLLKYEPQQILFLSRQTRQTFRYFDSPNIPKTLPPSHPSLLSGIPFQQGVLYLKQQSTLLNEIILRTRSHSRQSFSEEQIINTFEPLFQSLSHLHNNGTRHGCVHLESIVIVQDEIKLRDGLAPTKFTSVYYPDNDKKQPEDDIHALGICLVNCILMTTTKPELHHKEAILQQFYQKYSKNFVMALTVILREDRERYAKLGKILTGEHKDEKLIESYEKIRLDKERRRRCHQGQCGGLNHLAGLKKFAISHANKKVIHHENIQNKIDLQRKKSGEKSNHQIMDKGTLSQEIMNKKMNEEEKRLREEPIKLAISKKAILNLSNFGVENNSKKLIRERMSPAIKARHFSKKK